MGCALLLWPCVLGVVTPYKALAQSYQRYSDGLVSVQARKVADEDQRIGFEVCAQMLRQEKVCPLEIRLSFWEASGRLLAQAASVLRPEPSVPACHRIVLPDEAKDMSRWEISRFRCQRQSVRERPMEENGSVAPAHREITAWASCRPCGQ